MIEGLQLLLAPQLLLWVSVGVAVSTVIAVIPGLGGIFAMVLLLPFAFQMDPIHGIGMLVGATVVDKTANSVTSILFGIPGSPTGVATIFDGYPMAQQGQAARALGAAFTSSAVGGLVGALALGVLIPVVRPLVLAIGPAEFVVLIVIALILIAQIGRGNMLKALIAGVAGVAVSFVGQELSTATPRFTFGTLYLLGGVPLLPLIMGLYAIAEMVALSRSGLSVAKGSAPAEGSTTTQGILDTFRYWRATLQASMVGVLTGLVPGMGGNSATFMAYASVSRSSKTPEKFGRGSIEGVIAADASGNANEGGALVPALALGIPGSAGSAVLLGAMITLGVTPGADLITENVELVWLIVWILAFAAILASLLSLSLSGVFAYLTFLPAAVIVPSVYVVSVFGAYATTSAVGDILVVIVFGVIGYYMKMFDYSRATFIIGFVLGALLERMYLLSTRLYGLEMFTRPGVIWILAVAAVVTSGLALLRRRRPRS